MTSSLSRDLHAAATAMTVGRDLLHTHFATTTAGERRNQSEWAPLITAPPVRNALLAELARWANADSFTGSASSATIISHNCATLQRILATRAAQLGNTDLSNRLLASAKLSETAWQAWLVTTRGWQRIRTDTEGDIAPAAAEATDWSCGPAASPAPTLTGPPPSARAATAAPRPT